MGVQRVVNSGWILPYHDLAHVVVERRLGLRQGFYGNLDGGYSVGELSDKRLIATLPVESMVAEVVTRALQSLAGGGCRVNQFNDLINAELKGMETARRIDLPAGEVDAMWSEYRDILAAWRNLPVEGKLQLAFPAPARRRPDQSIWTS